MNSALQTARSHNGAYRKEKRRGKIPSLPSNHESDIQILQCQCIIVPEKVFPDKSQTKRLVIPVAITFGAEVLVTVAWHVLFEEAGQVFQTFFLVLLEIAAHDDDAPVGEVAHAVAVLPEADVAV